MLIHYFSNQKEHQNPDKNALTIQTSLLNRNERSIDQSYTFIGNVYDVNETRKPDCDNDTPRAELDFDSIDRYCHR
jgi:hypothetical protein